MRHRATVEVQTDRAQMNTPRRNKGRKKAGERTETRNYYGHVIVLVLGDIGRSPRMQYHAMSLTSHGLHVTLVGYTGEHCITALEDNSMVTFRRFDPPLSGSWGKAMKRRAYPLFAIAKALALAVRLVFELLVRPPIRRSTTVLVQNPPSLPSLACAYTACILRGFALIIDWHNLGFTMFGRGPRHPFVLLTRTLEGFFGRRADFNFTVSCAMRDWVGKNFGVTGACVVRDRPPSFFRSPRTSERHDLFKRLAETSKDFASAAQAHRNTLPSQTAHGKCDGMSDRQDVAGVEVTPFTVRALDGICRLRDGRPALLVSSTSWTPDEDFSVLLDALERFDARAVAGASPKVPFVVLVVTGKGPEKARYVEKMKASRMSKVAMCTAWLEPDDYPLLLGSADLGISLHTSTSGVDLPMKVVDMFGCGVPVCAAHFECLKELVQDGYNGCVFKDSSHLALQLEALLDGFPRAGSELQAYRRNVLTIERWDEEWNHNAWPTFENAGRKAQRRQSFRWWIIAPFILICLLLCLDACMTLIRQWKPSEHGASITYEAWWAGRR